MTMLVKVLRPLAVLIRVLIPPAILAAGLFAGYALFSSRPAPETVDVVEAAMPVRTIVPEGRTTTLDITAWGTVQPAREVDLRPALTGRLVEIDEAMVPGGLLAQGMVAAKIDNRDYRFAVEQALATLETAKFNLEVEEGRGRVARRDWETLGDEITIDPAGTRMALREPHRAERTAAVASAQSAVDKAVLALMRTELTVPFNAMVQSESAEVGQMVSSATTLATLIGTDEYRVEIGVPLDDLARLGLHEGAADTRPAVIGLSIGDGARVEYGGHVVGLTGSVDAVGRMARVLVEVPSPLEQSATRAVPLLLGAYVEVRLEGPPIEDVMELPRSAMREGGRVWIAGADGRLAFRDAQVVSGGPETVLVRVDLAPGESIITSPVPAPTPGMLLRLDPS